MTDDENKPRAGAPARPFASYTAADHARVAMAETAWRVLEYAYRAVVPEAHRAGPTALIEASLEVQSAAADLVTAAVIASHEQGLSWAQIGRGLRSSKQAAHERFADHVTAFRQALADRLAELVDDPDAEFALFETALVDTAWYAPKLDAWRVELGQLPGGMTAAGQPGELLARLSDADTAVTRLSGITARHPDATAPRCPFTADAYADGHADADPGDYLTCILDEGHPGRHQLAVANSYD